MDKTRLEDFRSVLNRHGYSESDFLINEKNLTDWLLDVLVPVRDEVAVKCRSTGKEKKYNSGNVTHWVADFEKDLQQGLFN